MEPDLDILAWRAKKNPDVAEKVIDMLLYKACKKAFSIVSYIPGEDKDDMKQLVRLALYEAIDKYKIARGISFRHFAFNYVIPNNLKNHLTKRKLRELDADYIEEFEEEEKNDSLIDPTDDISSLIVKLDIENSQSTFLNDMTDKEFAVFRQSLKGLQQTEISEELNETIKSVDGSLMRMRDKIRNSTEFDNWLRM